MAQLLLPHRWNRQPQGPVQIDWEHPLARTLKMVYFPVDGRNRVSGTVLTRTGTLPIGFGSRSNGISFTNSTANYLGSSTNGSPIQTTTADYRMSLFALVVPNSMATQQVIVALNGAGTIRTNLQISATGAPGYLVRQVDGGTAAGVSSTQTFTAGQQIAIAGVSSSQNSHSVYVNGVIGGTTTTSINAANSAYDRHYIGLDWPAGIGATAPCRGLVQLVLGWNRALTAAEVQQISANPWQIFQPTQRLIGAVVSAPSITRPNSDVTVTGWTGDPDNTNLYNNIDETSPSDTDFIISPSLGASPGPAIFGLTQSLATGTYNVRTRARRTGTSGQIRALLLDSSGTTVGTGSWQSLTASFTTYNLSVTTSGTAARVRLEVQ